MAGLPRFIIMFFVVAAIGLACHAQPSLSTVVHTSPSGAYALTVIPDNKEGSRGATYILKQNKGIVWSQYLDLALWHAIVTDDGTVGGVAYDGGLDGRFVREGRDDSNIHVIVIGPKGGLRSNDTRPRRHPNVLSDPPSPFEPRAELLLASESEDRLIVWIPPVGADRVWTWWAYRLSDGQPLGDFTPDQPRAEGGFHTLVSAELIPETPFMAVHWYCYKSGGRFAVLDAAGHEVWALDLSDEYAGQWNDDEGWDPSRFFGTYGVRQLACGPRTLEISSYTHRARITYIVERGDAESWVVRETARAGHALPYTMHDAHVSRFPPRELRPVDLLLSGTIDLRNEAQSPDEVPIESAAFVVGPGGRIYMADRHRGVINIFSSRGLLLGSLEPHGPKANLDSTSPAFSVRSDGAVLIAHGVRSVRGSGPPHEVLLSDNTPGGELQRVVDSFAEVPHARQGRRDWWAVGYERAKLVGEDGKSVITIDKRPDGAWIGTIDEEAVAPDGSLALITSLEDGLNAAGGQSSLCVYDSDGAPLGMFDLADGEWATSLVFNGAIACLVMEDSVLLVSRDGKEACRFRTLNENGPTFWHAARSLEGDELWLLDMNAARIYRYALPRSLDEILP